MQKFQELKLKEGTLRGYLHQPDTNELVPLVIMYHGFTGNKLENNFLFVQLSRYLCEHQIASLRFDFLGSGESDHDFSYMTFSKELKEAHAILDYAKSLPFYSEIIVLGLSMGGAIASLLAKERKDDIDKLILWAPAGNMQDIVKNQESIPSMVNDHYDLGGIELSKAFVSDMLKNDLWSGIEVYNKPVSIHHGTKDDSVPLEISKQYDLAYPKSQLHIYENGDHTFRNVRIRKQLFTDCLKFIK